MYGYSKLVPFENTVKIFYLKGNEQHFDDTNNSFFHSSWEQVMLWNKRMILHAALIDTVYGESFFQESRELEKQTQAELWECIWKMHGRLTETVRSLSK